MSVRGKVYKGYQVIERSDGIRITGTDTVTGKKIDMVPIVLKYEEAGIKSGMLVGVDPKDLELVLMGLAKVHGIANSGQIVDNIIGEGKIVIAQPGDLLNLKKN